MRNLDSERKKIIGDLQAVLGADSVLSERAELYAYAFDATALDEEVHLPDVVVFPASKNDVIEVLKVANRYKLPVVAKGAGTNHSGASVSLSGGIVIAFSKMDKIISIDEKNFTAKVQPGVIVGKLQEAVEKLGLFYPPDPSNLAVSTIGGSIALSSGGSRCFKYGTTKDYVVNLEVVLIDGRVLNTAVDIAKNVAGYDLTKLFVGSEGTLGIVTQATLKLIQKPQAKAVLIAYFDGFEPLVSACDNILRSRVCPSALDLLDKNTINAIENFLPQNLDKEAKAALLIEIDGFATSINEQLQELISILHAAGMRSYKAASNAEDYEKLWKARRSAYAAQARLGMNVISEDVAVPRGAILELICGIESIAEKYSLLTCILGHIGDGNIHPNFVLDLQDKAQKENFLKAKDEIFELALRLNGSISGEHGIGYDKSKYLPMMLPESAISLMKSIKGIFDPENLLNPGKILE